MKKKKKKRKKPMKKMKIEPERISPKIRKSICSIGETRFYDLERKS